MTCKVFLAFSNNDITKAIEKVSEDDIVLTDLFCPEHCGQTVEAIFKDASDPTLVSQVSNWFKIQSGYNDFSYGYVNVFYQSCIRPLAGFLTRMDEIVAVKGKEHVVFHLPVSLNWKRATSCYFLAEYESAGIHLYDRHSVLLPYIEDYLSANQISYTGGTRKLALQNLIYNPVRLWGVFLLRLVVDVRASIKKQLTRDDRVTGSFDKLFIIRTVGQAITIIPYLLSTRESICLVIGPSFADTGSFSILKRLSGKRENITIVRTSSPGVNETLIIYLKTVGKIFRCQDNNFNYKGLNINLTQALCEIIAMNAGLDIYRKQIHERIKEVSAAFIFSLEQKSPHAFVDAKLAKNSNTPSAQIQCCQQAFFDIPNPVCADFFLCETTKVKYRFQDSWAIHTNRLKYIGSFQGVVAKQRIQISRKYSNILRICLFLGVEKISNTALLKDFSKFAHLNKIELLVKLHPRDGQRYSSVCSDATYFTSYQDGFLEFSRTFDVAITFPSGVISDLVYSEVPFLVYIPQYKEYQITEAEYLPDGLEPMTSIESIFDKLNNMDELVRNHKFILANFIKDNGLVTNIESIELNLEDLILERKLMYNSEPLRKDIL
jgi:hypothetical protein